MTIALRTLAAAAVLLVAAPAAASERDESIQRCLADRVIEAGDETSVGTLRRDCGRDYDASQVSGAAVTAEESPVEARLQAERRDIDQPFTLLAHRPTYLLPFSYNAKVNDNQSIGADAVGDPERAEAGFQISFKLPLWRDVLGSGDNLFLAYTNRSFWQLYDAQASSPFRSSDHEPELFWRHYQTAAIGRFRFFGFDLGVSHQSNGRSRPLSRSWNRVVAATLVNTGDFALGIRTWLRLPENAEDDDNPDIEDYMGYGELRAIYAPNRNTFTLMMRPASKGSAVELTWSHRLSKAVRLYAQYYNGYGETLIDYDHRVDRYSIGIALNDYLVNEDRTKN